MNVDPDKTEQYLDRINYTQLKMFVDQLPWLLLAGVIAALFLSTVMWTFTSPTAITTFLFFLVLIFSIFTIGFVSLARHSAMDRSFTRQERFYFNLLALLQGSTWGLTAYLFYTPDNYSAQLILTGYILGVVSINSMIISPYQNAFYYFSSAIVIPFVIQHALTPGVEHIVIATSLSFYLFMVMYMNHRININMRRMISLQFESEDRRLEIEKAKMAQTRFFVAANHDLRQPLHAHGLLVSSLKKRAKDSESSRLLDILEKSMTGMQGLINSLLDVSRLDAGAFTPEVKPFKLREMLEQIFTDYESQVDSLRVKIALFSVDTLVLSDTILLERIIRNLVNNAVKYTEQGAILITARRRGEFIRIDIRDSGPGISEKEQQQIFNEFYQAKTKSAKPGLGLGLSIVKRLVQLLNLELSLKSAPGIGTTFSLFVPGITTDFSQAKLSNHPTNIQILKERTVLVVDDNPLILLSISQSLKDWGCNVIACRSSEEAFTALSSSSVKPELALLDYQLDNETGNQLAGQLREKYALDIPIVILTGDTAAEITRDSRQNDYLVMHKPVSPNVFKDILIETFEKAYPVI